jgi:hypothetical protein
VCRTVSARRPRLCAERTALVHGCRAPESLPRAGGASAFQMVSAESLRFVKSLIVMRSFYRTQFSQAVRRRAAFGPLLGGRATGGIHSESPGFSSIANRGVKISSVIEAPSISATVFSARIANYLYPCHECRSHISQSRISAVIAS